MDRSPVTIRPARPDLEEGRAFARYLDETAEGFIRFMYGPGYEEIIAGAFVKPGNEYSSRNAVFAERGGEIVGMASGFTALQRASFSGEWLKDVKGAAALRIRLVKMLFAPIIRIIETISPEDFYILAAAVDRDSRGLGIGTILLDAMEDRAREAGSRRLALDVAHSNTGARRLYERRGMYVESQWPKRLAISRLRFYRMIKLL